MNFIGKIFIILVLIMSIVFMTLALVVYTTHTNWRDLVENPQTGLRSKLDKARTDYNALKEKHDKLTVDLNAEIEAEKQQIAKLQSERTVLADNNTRLQGDVDELRRIQRDATAAMTSTQNNNNALTAQVTDLRDKNRANEVSLDGLFAKSLDATERRNQLVAVYEAAVQRLQQLTEQVARMTTVMRAKGVDPATDPNSVVQTVDGIVLAIRRTDGRQFVEVSLGSDDDLKPGQTLEVFRGSTYLGRVNVVETSPDKAVGQVDRRYQLGAIQEGDRVATRLNF